MDFKIVIAFVKLAFQKEINVMALTAIREDKVVNFLYWRSAKRTNKFIDSLISEAAISFKEAWQAEPFVTQKIEEWNASGNHYQLTAGSGGHHIYIQLADKSFPKHRLAIISEN